MTNCKRERLSAPEYISDPAAAGRSISAEFASFRSLKSSRVQSPDTAIDSIIEGNLALQGFTVVGNMAHDQLKGRTYRSGRIASTI